MNIIQLCDGVLGMRVVCDERQVVKLCHWEGGMMSLMVVNDSSCLQQSQNF